ncbi:ragulator complex protein LAMTOR4-like [Apostichopus japonicus]|uniref:ragulator complex protein LAMTOR4-like n=1 Tax=Stichopus japonicus TaxID=307972 RepID=UPI003AB5C10B
MSIPQHNLDHIPDQLGYLVLNEDGAVVSSAGDLENDERTAGILLNMVRLACKVQISEEKLDFFKRLSVIFDNFLYVATISNQKIYISKRKLMPKEPVQA